MIVLPHPIPMTPQLHKGLLRRFLCRSMVTRHQGEGGYQSGVVAMEKPLHVDCRFGDRPRHPIQMDVPFALLRCLGSPCALG